MYDNLKSLGITHPEDIDRYTLRQEANNDILKIYFRKDKGEFFAKSVKFKYPRQRKTIQDAQGFNELLQEQHAQRIGEMLVIDGAEVAAPEEFAQPWLKTWAALVS